MWKTSFAKFQIQYSTHAAAVPVKAHKKHFGSAEKFDQQGWRVR